MQILRTGVVIVLCMGLSHHAVAQNNHKATLRDSSLVSSTIYSELFNGLNADARIRAQAESIIRRTFVEQQKLLPVTDQRTWSRIVSLQASRDTALLRMAPPADRPKLSARLNSARPRSVRWKSWEPTQTSAGRPSIPDGSCAGAMIRPSVLAACGAVRAALRILGEAMV
jgi:hypothetical protein